MKDCPSCGADVPESAHRCKECFHDFATAPAKRSSPLVLLVALAAMSFIGAGTFWYVTQQPLDERVLVDKATQSIVWTRQFRDGPTVERLQWHDVAKLEYNIKSNGSYTIQAVTLDGERKLIQESKGNPIKSDADQYARLMDKPLETIDNTSGYHKMAEGN